MRSEVSASCKNWLDEFRIFARGENGNVMNEAKFHLMAATSYLLLDTLSYWLPEQPKVQRPVTEYWYPGQGNQRWMQ